MLNAMRRASIAIAIGLATFACGGEAGVELDRRSANTPAAAPVGADAGVPDPVEPPAPGVIPEPAEPPPFEEPGCPPVAPQPAINECDPLAPVSGCPEGEACFPYVDYPAGPCDVERYGAVCRPEGPGTQGESCAGQSCAADYLCISTGRGTQCARLCGLSPDAPNVCAPGLLCLPVDIEGFGGCL